MALTIFGHASINQLRVEDYEMDLEAVAKANGWWVHKGTLVFGIFKHEQSNIIPPKGETKSKKRSAD